MRNNILMQVTINHPELSNDERAIFIRQAYLSVLKNDNLWHFFHEEEMGDIIRCCPENMPKLVKWLDKHGIKHFEPEPWKETVSQVVDNVEFFAEYFHLISKYLIEGNIKLDLENSSAPLSTFIDRLVHPVYLNNKFLTGLPQAQEERVLANMANDRAFYSGIRYEYKILRDYYEKKNGKDKVSGV